MLDLEPQYVTLLLPLARQSVGMGNIDIEKISIFWPTNMKKNTFDFNQWTVIIMRLTDTW